MERENVQAETVIPPLRQNGQGLERLFELRKQAAMVAAKLKAVGYQDSTILEEGTGSQE